jgi:serine/threonine protein phosphatase PrpC
MLDILFGAATDTGMVRAINEDSVLAFGAIAAVADGMGGHAAGEVASQIAVERLSHLAGEQEALKPDDLIGAIFEVNQEILAAVVANPDRDGMGTTLSGLGVVRVGGSDHWMVFNVGDSRVYRLSDGMLTRVTVDHSVVEELIASGALSAEEAKVHPQRNVVTRSLGTDPAPQADVWVFPPTPGERFLICSDGLPLEIDDDQIGAVLRSEPNAQRAADELVSAAVSAGGHDNVTVIIVDLLSPEKESAVSVDTAPRMHPRGDVT